MRLTGKVLIKGVSVRDGKKKTGEPVKYHNAELYGLDGRAEDIQASIDMSNGTGQSLMQKAEKFKFQPVTVVLEYTSWEGHGRFALVDFDPLKA